MARAQQVEPVHNDGVHAAALQFAGDCQAGQPRADDYGGGPLDPPMTQACSTLQGPSSNGASCGAIPRTLSVDPVRTPAPERSCVLKHESRFSNASKNT